MNRFCIYIFVTICMAFTGCGAAAEIPEWNQCTLSSNWHGENAAERMMNILSPVMPDSVFNERVSFMKSRGANTAHLILCNKSDGEYAGYSIYGGGMSWSIDRNFTDIMTERIEKLRKDKFGQVLWLLTDDSYDWNMELAANFNQYVNDIASLGWFEYASTVVVGLELDEYYDTGQVTACVNAIRRRYGGKIGVHHTSGKASFADCADILFYQVKPGYTPSQIAAAAETALKVGKPVNFFESGPQESRENCQAALDAGAFAVGNW